MRNSLQNRRCVPEVMDDPNLESDRHHAALSGLIRINWLSGSDRIVWRAVERLAQAGRVVRLLDIASGAGDVPIRLWQRARRVSARLEIVGADISPTAIQFARERAARENATVSFIPLDALNDALPGGFDIITSSLFLHHLDEDQAICLLAKMRESAGQLALVNDLLRCQTGYFAAWLGSRALTGSDVVHVDAPRSVAAAFTLDEVRKLADRAGWAGATLSRRWPWRFLLQWSRPQ